MKQHEAEQKRMKAEALKIFQERLIPRSRQKSSKNQFAGLENAVIQWGWLDTYEIVPRWEQDLIEQELWENLNNLIYQKMREESLPSVNHMLGYDHAGRFWQILQAYACGDLVSVPRMLPEEIGVAKGHYPCFRVAINLIISEIYCDNAIKTEALAAADKFLTGNFSQWEKGVITFLAGISRRKLDILGDALESVCRGWNRQLTISWDKAFCRHAHGLYGYALTRLSQEEVDCIKLPNFPNFSQGYAQFQKTFIRNAMKEQPQFTLYLEFPKEMEIVNQIYFLPVAVSALHMENCARVLDWQQMLLEMAAELRTIMGKK